MRAMKTAAAQIIQLNYCLGLPKAQSETIIKLKYLGLSEDGYVILYTQAIRYTAKETLSWQDTETQKGQEKEPRLHKESTNAKKGNGRRRGGGV